MANVVMRHTSPFSDTWVYDDDTVITDGVTQENAVVSEYEGTKRVSLHGDSIIQINPVPELCNIRVTRQVGWEGNLGFKVELLDIAADEDPAVLALAVYNQPDGVAYAYTTGAMVLDPETDLWGAVCPAGFEPGDVDIHLGMLYASINYSAFTLNAGVQTAEFVAGGDFGTPPIIDPSEGTEWVDSGQTVGSMAGTTTIIQDNSGFVVGNLTKIDNVEQSVQSLWVATGLTLDPYTANTIGAIVYKWE